MNKARNYRIFLSGYTIAGFASGLFNPFWVIFIQGFGGSSIESFGFALGLVGLAQSVTTYIVGKHSDKLGRKPYLIIGGVSQAIIIVCYTFITSIGELYTLQILLGIASAIENTMVTALLGDLTDKSTRGADVGRYSAVTGIFSAIAMMIGGFVVKYFGINIIFYLVAVLFLVTSSIIFFINEKNSV